MRSSRAPLASLARAAFGARVCSSAAARPRRAPSPFGSRARPSLLLFLLLKYLCMNVLGGEFKKTRTRLRQLSAQIEFQQNKDTSIQATQLNVENFKINTRGTQSNLTVVISLVVFAKLN